MMSASTIAAPVAATPKPWPANLPPAPLVDFAQYGGVPVETPNGLVVPVIRDCDQKSIGQLALELADKAERARGKGLPMAEMSGGCFSISSLGSIGGTGFSPIINAPEVAILGVSRTV